MNTFTRLILVVMLATLTTACATATRGVPVGGGWRMHIGFESNQVMVANATTLPGELYMNNGYIGDVMPGSGFTVSLGGVVRNNVLRFNWFSIDSTGKRVLQGVTTATFQGGAGTSQEWTLRYVQSIQ